MKATLIGNGDIVQPGNKVLYQKERRWKDLNTNSRGNTKMIIRLYSGDREQRENIQKERTGRYDYKLLEQPQQRA